MYFSLADIGDFRAHIFYPQTTQELPRSTMKQDSLNKLEQLPTDALSQIEYGHTGHCEDGKTIACAN